MRHPCKETFKAKTISAMFTASILALISEPIIWVFIKTVVLERLDQGIMIRDTTLLASYEFEVHLPHRTAHNFTDSGD